MKKFILTLSFLFLNVIVLISQTPYFNIYYTDVSEFPKVKMHFNAANFSGQNIPYDLIDLNDFRFTENGVDVKLDKNGNQNLDLVCGDNSSDIPLSVILALDCTKSMEEIVGNNQTRFQWVREAANLFVDSLKFIGNTEVTVMGFAGYQVFNSGWLESRAETKFEIAELNPISGFTNFNPPFDDPNNGIFKTFKSAKENTRKVVIFLTDGSHELNGDPSSFKYLEYAETAIKVGIEIYAVEVNVSATNNRLNSLTGRTGGYFENVDSKQQLYSVFDKFYFDLQHNSNKCWFEYTAPLACAGDDNTREVFAAFDKYKSLYELTQTFTYDAPNDKLYSIDVDKTDLLFSNNTGGATSQKITLSANETDFQIDNISVYPDNANFTITPKNILIPKGESREITINYTPQGAENSEVYDLMINSSPCPVAAISLVSPCSAEFDDLLTFKNIPLNQKRILTVDFKNTTLKDLVGKVELTGADAGKFTILDDDINLKTDETKTVSVEFESDVVGTFNADLVFNVNDECGIFTTKVEANAIKASLALTPLEFGELRIGLTDKKTYTISNNDTQNPADIVINSISWENSNENFNDVLNISETLPFTLAPNESIELEVEFTPNTVGTKNENILIEIKDNADLSVLNVNGIGTLPEVSANSVVFQDTDYQTNSDIEKVIIENNGNEDLLINEILINSDSKHSQDYTIITTPLTNLTIAKGQSMEIEVQFTPQAGGLREAEIDIIHNAAFGDLTVDKVYKVNLEGVGIVNKQPYTFDLSDINFNGVSTCENESFNYTIVNNSKEQWDLILEIEGTNDFYINQQKSYNFSLDAGQSETVELNFNPSSLGIQTANIKIISTDNLVSGSAQLEGEGISEDIMITIDNPKYTSARSFEPGDRFDFKINLSIPDYERLVYNTINIEVKYSHKHNPYDAEKGASFSLNDWNFQIVENNVMADNNDFSLMKIKISKATDQTGSLDGKITIPLKAMLNNKINQDITVNASIENINCINYIEATQNIKIEACGSEFSAIFIGNPTELEKVAPNPINISRELSYSNTYEDLVVIDLVDMYGNIVKEYVRSVQSPGQHSFILDIEKLSTGKYMLRLQHTDKLVAQQVMIIR